ncbi:hypothetical protein ACT1UH_02950 [Mycoplasma sp. 332]|uniref:hypothetical protein n=1 Tax=Mycoplasma sp. 332 TaxID=3458236 RepID=UPI004035AB8E
MKKMEITKINEVVDKSVLQSFYVKAIQINEICTIPGSINYVNFDTSKLTKISAMVSDFTYNQSPLTEGIDSDSKYTIIFNEKIDFTNKFLILKNAITENEYYIVENINTTFSPEKLNEVVNVTIAQKLEDYVNNKKFLICPNTLKNNDDTANSINVEIRENFLFQKASIETPDNFQQEIPQYRNMLPMIVNPIEVNEENCRVFMAFLSKYSIVDVREINVNKHYGIYAEDQLNNGYKDFFKKIYEIYNYQNLIMSGYANKTKEEIEEFKRTFSGNNAEEYVNAKLAFLRNSSYFPSEQIDLLILMCSGFLKSIFCFNGGFSNFHKFLLPFYFEMKGEILYLRSEFYSLEDELEIAKIEEIKKSRIIMSFNKAEKDSILLNTNELFGESSSINLENYKKWYRANISGAILNKKYRNYQSVDYLDLPLNLKEVNIDLDYSKANPDYIKYKLNLIIPNKINSPYEFLFNNKPVLNSKGEEIKPKNRIRVFLDPSMFELNKKYSPEFFDKYIKDKYGSEWKIASKFKVYKAETSMNVMYTYHGLTASNHYVNVNNYVPESFNRWINYRSLGDSSWKEVTENFNYEFKVRVKELWYHTGNWDVVAFWLSTDKITKSLPIYYHTVEVKTVSFWIEKDAETQIEEYPSSTKILFKNNFILNSTTWKDFANSLGEIESLKFEVMPGHKLIIKGLFLPQTIIINNKLFAIPKIKNQTQIHIKYIE